MAFDYGAAREVLRDDVHGAAIPCSGEGCSDDDGFIAAVARIGGDGALLARMRLASRDAVSALRPTQVAEDFERILLALARREVPHVAPAAA